MNIDVVYQVAAIPRPGETVLATDSAELDGGKGGNQAVAAARLGAQVTMIACVGTDPAVTGLSRRSSRRVWESTRSRRRGARTGTATVLLAPDAENVIVVSPAANALLQRPTCAPHSRSRLPGWS